MRISPAVVGLLVVPFVLLFVAFSFVPSTRPPRPGRDFIASSDSQYSDNENEYADSNSGYSESQSQTKLARQQADSPRFSAAQPAKQATGGGWGAGGMGGASAAGVTRGAGGAGGRAPGGGPVDTEYYQRELASCRHELNMRLADGEGSGAVSGVQETLQRKEGQIGVLKAIRHAFARKLDLRCPYVRDYRVPSNPGKQKLQVLRDFAKKYSLKTFVETGTYQGETLFGMMQQMDDLHSIELSPYHYQSAATLFANVRKVRLYQGDSASILPSVLAQIRQPALIWLDGHYTSAEKAVRGASDPPVILDLLSIFEWPYAQQSVIVIDDAHLFAGYDACNTAAGAQCFPAVRDIAELLCAHYPDLSLQVENDAIRIFKALPQQPKGGGLSGLLKGGSPKAASSAPNAGAKAGAPPKAPAAAATSSKWGAQAAAPAAPRGQPAGGAGHQQQRAAGGAQGGAPMRGGGQAAGGGQRQQGGTQTGQAARGQPQGARGGQQPAAGGKYRPPSN